MKQEVQRFMYLHGWKKEESDSRNDYFAKDEKTIKVCYPCCSVLIQNKGNPELRQQRIDLRTFMLFIKLFS